MDTCNNESMSVGTRNVVFACNNIFIAAKLLNENYPDISDTLLKLSSSLLATLSPHEMQNIDKAIQKIQEVRQSNA